jgi:hypothetical protein
MMATFVAWHGDKVTLEFELEMRKRLELAGFKWVRKAKEGLNKRLNRDGENPSGPNQFPAQVTSHLKENIVQKPTKRRLLGYGDLVKMVGTNVAYGKWLELGTHSSKGRFVKKLGRRISKGVHPGMKRRPWMSLTNRLMRKEILAILKKPFKGKD